MERNLDRWVSLFNQDLNRAIDQPIREIPSVGKFSDWRISYGMHTSQLTCEGKCDTYFMAFYPAFCTKPRAMFHYTNVSELAHDIIALESLAEDAKVPFSDVVATICSYMRDKESIELFQEQKDLMVLGLVHYHLDNFYQEVIKGLVDELYEKGTVKGIKVDLTIFKNVKRI